MREDELSNIIIGCAIEVHKVLGGPGLYEKIYEEAFVDELRSRGLDVKQQVKVYLNYKGKQLGTPFFIDIIVNNKVIIELKAISEYNSIFATQTLTYLRITNLRLGLIINFGMPTIKRGVKRVVNKLANDKDPKPF